MIDRKVFFDRIRVSPFGGTLKQEQVDGLTTLLDVFERDYRWPDLRWLAYALATTYHETAATMQPVTEYGSSSYLRGKPYWPYIGRGYVQLTWDYNYRKMGGKLGVDLMAPNEDRALDPALAAKILFVGMRDGDFTGKKLSDYFNATADEPVAARRIINGNDRASMIAGYHDLFLHALDAAKTDAPSVDETVWVRRSDVAKALRALADQIEAV